MGGLLFFLCVLVQLFVCLFICLFVIVFFFVVNLLL